MKSKIIILLILVMSVVAVSKIIKKKMFANSIFDDETPTKLPNPTPVAASSGELVPIIADNHNEVDGATKITESISEIDNDKEVGADDSEIVKRLDTPITISSAQSIKK